MTTFLPFLMLGDGLRAMPMRGMLVIAFVALLFAAAGAIVWIGQRRQAAQAAKDLSSYTGTGDGAHKGGDQTADANWWAAAVSDDEEMDSHPSAWRDAFLGDAGDTDPAAAPTASPAPPVAQEAPQYAQARTITPLPVATFPDPDPGPSPETAAAPFVDPAEAPADEFYAAPAATEDAVPDGAAVEAPGADWTAFDVVEVTAAPEEAPVPVAPLTDADPAPALGADTWTDPEQGDLAPAAMVEVEVEPAPAPWPPFAPAPEPGPLAVDEAAAPEAEVTDAPAFAADQDTWVAVDAAPAALEQWSAEAHPVAAQPIVAPVTAVTSVDTVRTDITYTPEPLPTATAPVTPAPVPVQPIAFGAAPVAAAPSWGADEAGDDGAVDATWWQQAMAEDN